MNFLRSASAVLAVLRQHQAEPVPLLYASTCPGGPLTSECYAWLKGELIERLQQALPLDGVLLPLHGAAAVEDIGDLEGDLIKVLKYDFNPSINRLFLFLILYKFLINQFGRKLSQCCVNQFSSSCIGILRTIQR